MTRTLTPMSPLAIPGNRAHALREESLYWVQARAGIRAYAIAGNSGIPFAWCLYVPEGDAKDARGTLVTQRGGQAVLDLRDIDAGDTLAIPLAIARGVRRALEA